MNEQVITVDPNKIIERLMHQNAVLNRELLVRDIAIEQMQAKIEELENGNANAAQNGGRLGPESRHSEKAPRT
jgi:beta-lactamase class D